MRVDVYLSDFCDEEEIRSNLRCANVRGTILSHKYFPTCPSPREVIRVMLQGWGKHIHLAAAREAIESQRYLIVVRSEWWKRWAETMDHKLAEMYCEGGSGADDMEVLSISV